MNRSFLLTLCALCALLLSGCATPTSPYGGRVPSSERLETVRLKTEPHLRREVASAGLSYGAPVFIRVFKKESLLELWIKDEESKTYKLFKSYPVCKFSGGLGPKLREGDGQAPEGFYTVGAGQLNPKSAYHLSFDLGYPNAYDKTLGRTGTLLMIHGDCKSVGCYAMTDEAIEEIYLLTEASIAGGADVPVHIFPFRMNNDNIYANFDPMWITFWRNLQEGHDIFEQTAHPPTVAQGYGHEGHKYVFEDQTNMITQLKKELEARGISIP